MSGFNMSVSTFPLTVVGIPIATVCPSGIRSAISNANFAVDLGSGGMGPFQLITLPTTSFISSSMITASAKLPDGSMTAFSSLIRREVEMEAAPEVPFLLPDGSPAIDLGNNTSGADAVGRIVIGSEGCQTLYTPTTTAICSTVVSPIGLPPVTVTDCSQYITFSSETAYTCAPTSDITPVAASNIGDTTSTYSSLGASVATAPSAFGSAVSDLAPTGSAIGGGVGPADIMSSVTTDTTLDLPTVTDLPAARDGSTGSISLLTRRDFVYTSVVNDDIPMSLPRQLWPEQMPGKRHVRKRQVESTGGFDITIVRHMDVQEDATVTVEPSVSDIQTMPQSISMSVPDSMDMSMNPTVSDMAPLSQATNLMIPENMAMRMVPTMSSVQSVPVATDLMGKSTRGNAGVSVDPTVSETVSVPQPTEDMTVTTMPTVSDPSMPTAAEATTPTLSNVDSPTTPNPSILALSDTLTSMASDPILPPDSTMASISALDATDLPMHAVQLSPPQPTKYYAAPWYQLTGAFGAVPTNVKGIKCYGGVEPPDSCVLPDPNSGDDPCGCEIDDEIWSVLTLTQTKIGTTVVSFDGPVEVTASGQTLTTSISFTETLTTTREVLAGGIAKSTILATSSGDDATVYATQTTFPSVTMTMLPGDGVSGNSTASITTNSQDSSSVVDAAAPQSSPASISSQTSLSTTGLSVTSESSAMNTEIEGTTFVTSFVATETVTMPPSNGVTATNAIDSSPAKPTVAPIPDLTDGSVLSMETNAVDGPSLAVRDDWPTDVWR